MNTVILDKNVSLIADALKQSKVVAFPTDTVYGLGCIYNSEEAINKIKYIKGRSNTKPLPMMVSNLEQLKNIVVLSENAIKLFEHFTPGPLTLILKKDDKLPSYVNNGFDTVAIRIPNDKFILELIDTLNLPLLVTSANRSDSPSGTTLLEVLDQISNGIDFIVAGECQSKVASTIIDLSEGVKLIREGEISFNQIMEVIK